MNIVRAIELNYIELVKEMVTKDNVNDIIDIGISWTALHCACYWDKVDIVKYLISIGADINESDYLGYTPLDIAIYHDSIEVKAYLESLIVKEVTMEEVCKKFGCNVKIVK